MDNYDTFCSAVLRAVPSATRQEQDAIRRELREHLEDHAAALEEMGAGVEEAAQAAVEAMGDPEEIGRALSRSYPHRWQVLETCTSLLLGFFLIVAAIPTFISLYGAYSDYNNINAARGEILSQNIPVRVYDLSIPLGDQTLRLYGIQNEPETVTLYCYMYHHYPTQIAAGDAIAKHLAFYLEDGTPLDADTHYISYGRLSYGLDKADSAAEFSISVSVPEDADTFLMTYDRYGYAFTETIERNRTLPPKGAHTP